MATQTELSLLEPLPRPMVHPGSESLSTETEHDRPDAENAQPASRLRKLTVTFQLSAVNFTSSGTNGLVIISLPRMTADLNLPQSLAFWPSSVQGLATASTLLLAGALADVLGPRAVDLTGCFLSGCIMLASGFVLRGEELVVLRAMQGIALALHLSSSVALLTKIWPRGQGRNLSFSCLGLSLPLGFSFGLVIGGVLNDTIGWRSGWYLYGGINLALATLGLWSLPRSMPLSIYRVMHNLKNKVDWLGTLLASAFMALLSYSLAVISTDVYRIKEATTIVFLCLGMMAAPLFISWMHFQTKRGKPALIPNSFWGNHAFTSICITVALSNAVLNSSELFASLYFQEIQHQSALNAALRILPNVIVGVALNFTTGLVVHKIPAIWLIASTAVLTAGSPLIMALIQPHWSYWSSAFFAQLLTPFSVDVLYTVGLIIVTEVFPEDKQALAGAVFNTAGQFGNAIGLAIMQVVSTLVTKQHVGMKPSEALLEGYRASFWTMFAFMIVCAIVGGIGLRKAGRVGLKQD